METEGGDLRPASKSTDRGKTSRIAILYLKFPNGCCYADHSLPKNTYGKRTVDKGRNDLQMAWILSIMTYSEFVNLVACVSLDVVEYVVPFLLQPIIGDLLDIIGLATCIYLFRWIGLIAVLELVPGLDFLPINILTWVIWFVLKHREDFTYGIIRP